MTANGQPLLSVIIVNWNARDCLRTCLDSIQTACSSMEHEVLVVDNNSTDGSQDMVRESFPQVRLIANHSNAGFPAATNQGLRASRGRFLALLNPDTVILGDALIRLINFLEGHPEAGASGPRILFPDGSVQLECGRRFPTLLTELFEVTCLARWFPRHPLFGRHRMGDWNHDTLREVELLSGACIATRRETVEDVGAMSESVFMYEEDLDWCFRMRHKGWKLYLVPEAEIIHLGGQSSKLVSPTVRTRRHHAVYHFMRKYYGPFHAATYRAMVFLCMVPRVCRGWIAELLSRPRGRAEARQKLQEWLYALSWSFTLRTP